MEDNQPDFQPSDGIPTTAALFEGSLAVIALVLGWVFGVMPIETLSFSLSALGWGLAATLPLLIMLGICVHLPWRPLDDITRTVENIIGPMLRHCRLIDLAAISLLAGLGEEMLFRGFLQPLVAGWIGGPAGVWIGLAVASVVFGMLHAVTKMYALLACLIGAYLGWLWLASGNLLVPITAHAVYDFLALVYFLRIRSP